MHPLARRQELAGQLRPLLLDQEARVLVDRHDIVHQQIFVKGFEFFGIEHKSATRIHDQLPWLCWAESNHTSSSFWKIAVNWMVGTVRRQPSGVSVARTTTCVIFMRPPGAGTDLPSSPRMNAIIRRAQAFKSCASVLTA